MKQNLSTFQPFNFSTRAIAAAASFATAAAMAAPPADLDLTLGEVELPVYMSAYNQAFTQPTVAYPISTVRAPTEPGEIVTVLSGKDATIRWELAAWTIGRTLSEQPPDAKLGEFCTDIPFDPSEIDWAATVAANATAIAEGRVVFNNGATNGYERVIFTASGATEMTWVGPGGATVTQTYNIGSSSSARPYRIFATRVDEANSAAFIDLTGKFVRFFGDPKLLRSEYKESAPGVSNVVYGLDYNPATTKMLTVRYRANEETGAIDCPQGQFVLAYYDTETKDHMVAHVVVEICPPTVATLNAEVGECLKPAGGGFGTERLYSVVAAGAAREDNDPYSPYVEKYSAAQGEELTDPDHDKIFAIAPTDVSTSSSGAAMPWKADVFWQTEDPMKTKWNFEHDWYLISWPQDPLRVVISPAGSAAGCPVIVPTNYVVTTGFKLPADVSASYNSYKGELDLKGGHGGKILVRLSNQNGGGCPSYLPMEMTDYRDASVATATVFEWPVGIELTPRIGIEAGANARAMSERVDDNLPGFIYEPESLGRNWNPRLYHRPRGGVGGLPEGVPSLDEMQSNVTEDTESDPFASLQSAIYGVNGVDNAKIQVWWRANFQTERMPVPVNYPTLVQNYRVTWDMTMAPGLLPQIALSSEQGSSDPTLTACGERSLLLVEPNSTASVDLGGRGLSSEMDSATVGFTCYVSPDGDATPGRLASWRFGERGSTDDDLLEAKLESDGDGGFRVVIVTNGVDAVSAAINPGEWSDIQLGVGNGVAGRGVTVTYGASDATAGDSATFVALDNLAVWYGDAASPTDNTAVYNFDFGADDLTTLSSDGTVRTATDAAGNVLMCRGCAVSGAGAPELFRLALKAEDGVEPEIYYENDWSKVGYNPNEEHAFVDSGTDGYVVWALRDDLNTDATSKPVVMVMYAENGKGRMQAFTISRTSIYYPEMASAAIVGNPLLPPAPIGRLAGCQTSIDTAASAFAFDDNAVAYKDRKNGLWARRDGVTSAKYGYPMQSGFYFPSLAEQPAVGTPIAWLACRDIASPSLSDVTNIAAAADWYWVAQWPTNVPTLKIGQVLTKATLGLPEMWNAASMAVCYPNPSMAEAMAGLADPATRVKLIDPTVVQTSTATLDVKSSFPDEYGFILGPSGTTFLRKGKYYFNGLPPSISDRFYVTVEDGGLLNPGLHATMNLVGQLVEKEAGGSYLELNVLTAAERAAIKALCVLDPVQKAKEVNAWNAAADSLALTEVEPSPCSNTGKAIESKGQKEMSLAFPSGESYTNWLNKIASDDNILATNRFTVSEFEFSELGTLLSVLAGKEAAIPGAAFATWTEEKAKVEKVKDGRLEYAKKRYEELGLDKYLKQKWDDVASNATSVAVCFVKGHFDWKTEEHPAANTYLGRDHYALVADGTGVGYVTLIENDNPDPTQVSEGLPVQMHVIKVVPELYADGIAVLSDSLNKLSEKLTLLYRTPLGSTSDKYEFQWCYTTPNADGSVPVKGSAFWKDRALDAGLVSLQLGQNGANLQDYVNTYYTLRYRPLRGSDTWNLLAAAHPEWTSDEQFWSPWADEQLAEGWLQRVLNALTPFAQRVEDFYNNPSDIWLTMLEQIGRPYQGDVALNNDNLTEVGLLELYQTVFNRAESLLVAAGGKNIDMSKQLMLAQTRMGEFYSLLGAEAYSDAKNPLIPAGYDGQQFASGTFSFANQVPSLLDEELALLRGRTSATAFPRMTEAPLYNRLAWNLTKGITEGEPAYVANYGIRARDGILDVNCAAVQYPQGHGDAWGHYLSALTGYYRLLRNPWFDWTAAMGEMLMDQKLMNVDYQDEQKFADAAVKLVQTGTDAMDLTLRKAYKENKGDATAAYFDADREQAFGYGEWATRTGMAAAYNWMAVNALLPTNDAPYQAFTDKGVKKINRFTASELPVLASSVRVLQRKLGGFESGANPLGLSENAIPFDIDPDRLAQKESHFEQILERAEKSLANCQFVLDYANVFGSRLAQVSKDEESLIAEVDAQEQAFNNSLIAIYGTPYSGDIGVGRTYPQGYDGPDLYNYNYMDLTPFGILEDLQTIFTNSYKLVERDTGHYVGLGWKYKNDRDWLGEEIPDKFEEIPISYIVNEGGIRMKPPTVTGSRRMEGTIQAAYRNYIQAYLKVKELMSDYDTKLETLKFGVEMAKSAEKSLWRTLGVELGTILAKLPADTMSEDFNIDLCNFGLSVMMVSDAVDTDTVPAVSGAGTTVVTDPKSLVRASMVPLEMFRLRCITAEAIKAYHARYSKQMAGMFIDFAKSVYDMEGQIQGTYDELRGKIDEAAMAVNLAILPIQPAFADLAAAEAAYRAEVEKGQQLLEQRALWRQQVSNGATERRYLDMYNRVQRNIALTKYTTAFDTAQRYVWELAKVYDYETGLLSSDPQAGKQFLADIIATRSLGQNGVSISSATTDGGLYDIVNRMKANWDVLKPRLGINNPDKPEKWFSLRYERFRIKPDASGDEAWRRELRKYWQPDIYAVPEVARHCQPLAGQNSSALKEPGLVIPFSTSIHNAENFFGHTLQGGESQFSSADYATKIAAVGVDFAGYDALTTQTTTGLATEPNIYLVPVGTDYMRAPAGTTRTVLGWNVVDQVLPLPYTIGSDELDAQDWIATFSGLDGTSDATATIRRHSTLRAGGDFTSSRLVGRSVWNDQWLLVIPASSLNADRARALDTFIGGVGDIRIGIKAYSRQGN